uniref:Uncharacterized protein n=1 Tax=Anopheles coluzzii TaxID=1518534 RepID=A0A8W7P9B2_ANOCL
MLRSCWALNGRRSIGAQCWAVKLATGSLRDNVAPVQPHVERERNSQHKAGALGYSSKPYSSLGYLGSKGYSSTATGVRSKSAFDKDVITPKVKKPKLRQEKS